VAAWIVFALSSAYLLRRRGRLAFIVGLGALFFLGALMVEVRTPDNADSSEWLRFADGTEVMVMTHVTKEATLQEDGPGSLRQRIEVETEQITRGDENLAVNSGLRITYGHPRREVLARLGEAHGLTYRTDFDGAVTFYLDGSVVIPSLARAEVH
jgi:hypothetical protein